MRYSQILLLALSLASPAFSRPLPPQESPSLTPVPELMAGFRLLYEQKFPEGRQKFVAWAAQNPDQPLGQVAIAASFLFEEFYQDGVLTSDFFLDDEKFLGGIQGKPDPVRMQNFLEALRKARELAKTRLKKNSRDPDALFAMTIAAGTESNADSILFKKPFDALKRMKEANENAKELLAQHPDAFDAWVAPGSANYIIGSLSAGFRALLWFGGVHGDRKLGMEQVDKTAEKGRYLQPFAKILLALSARREKQDELAKRLLKELTEEFPASPLFAAEYAKVMKLPVPAQIGPR